MQIPDHLAGVIATTTTAMCGVSVLLPSGMLVLYSVRTERAR
jgi:hypothetical protein